MAIISDGFNAYTERDGKMELINPESISMKMGDDDVFRFDGKSGVLELSMSQEDIDLFVRMHGGVPIPLMHVPAPFEQPIVQNVREVRPLPTKDGRFLMSIPQQPLEPEVASVVPDTKRTPVRRSFWRRIFG